ncbi:heterokaryon incompatibility protein-domain-containing protein [Sordaria brevicollis]|uniref:Heterokaryon incompatibility protein-domain-containing protein n=1 Tax=Sordaria brevicollis TaxID=83679 RepID=A0AAE0P3E1_SORBR|nr:heterokaryon incompatibility protein-domain-containing protein [Sordaria brevicollis]
MESTGLTFALDPSSSPERRLRKARSAPPLLYKSTDWNDTVKSGHTWPPWETRATELDELCDRCRSIDIQYEFDPDTLRTRDWKQVPAGSHYRDLLVLADQIFTKDASCPLCRFFYSLRWPQLLRPAKISLNTWPPSTIFETYSSNVKIFWNRNSDGVNSFPLHNEFYPVGVPVLAVSQGPEYLSYVTYDMGRSRYRNAYCVPELVLTSDFDYKTWRSVPGKALRVLPFHVNYKLIQAWLARCHYAHSQYCLTEEVKHSCAVSCIDSTTREIVTIRPGDEYLALSYVWGDSAHANRGVIKRNDGRRFVAKNVAKVIEDAIIVVRNLGKRYLWVDQLCIDQDSNTDKQRQIHNMHNIYEGACATIVAAAGADSSFGLPGVSRTPRSEQLYLKTTSFSLVGSLPLLSEALRNTVWCTRGWTYQEAVLSRRLIIFTEHQVYFTCRAATWGEDNVADKETFQIAELSSGEPGILGPQMFRQTRWHQAWGSSSVDEKLDTHINKFCQRTLSCETDMLDAIRGLLSRSPWYTYYGMIVHKYQTAKEKLKWNRKPDPMTFITSLYFNFRPRGAHLSNVTRRAGLPSWSWVGWKAPAGVDMAMHGLNSFDDKAYFGKLEVEDKDGSLITMLDLLASHTRDLSSPRRESRVIPELSRYIWIENVVIQVGFHLGGKYSHFYLVRFCLCHPFPKKDRSPVIRQPWWEKPPYECPGGQTGTRFDHGCTKANDPMFVRMLTESWHCLLLGRDEWESCFLILDWSEDRSTAYRVGTLSIKCTDEEWEELLRRVPNERRKVRLG